MLGKLRRMAEGYLARRVAARILEASRETPEAFRITRLIAQEGHSDPATATDISYDVLLVLHNGAMGGEMLLNPDPGDEIEDIGDLTFADFGRPIVDPALRERVLSLLRKETILALQDPSADAPRATYTKEGGKGRLDVGFRRP